MPTLDELKQLRDTFMDSLVAADQIDAEYKARKAAWEEAHTELIASREAIKALHAENDKALREAAVAYYLETPEKNLIDGVGIEEVTEARYDDLALWNYAVTNSPFLLQLNPKAVNDLALSMAEHANLKLALAGRMPLEAVKIPRAEVRVTMLRKMADLKGASE